VLPKPKDIISEALGTILSAFEDANQMPARLWRGSNKSEVGTN